MAFTSQINSITVNCYIEHSGVAKEDGRADGGWGYGFNKFIGTRLSDRVAMRSKKYL